MLHAQNAILASDDLLVAEAAAVLAFYEQGLELPPGASIDYPAAFPLPVDDGKKEVIVLSYVGFEARTIRGRTEYRPMYQPVDVPKGSRAEALNHAVSLNEKYARLVRMVKDRMISCYINPIGEKQHF